MAGGQDYRPKKKLYWALDFRVAGSYDVGEGRIGMIKPDLIETCPGCGEETLEVRFEAPDGQECFCPSCDWPYYE